MGTPLLPSFGKGPKRGRKCRDGENIPQVLQGCPEEIPRISWPVAQDKKCKKRLGKPNLSPLPNLPFQRRLRHPQAQGPVPPIPAGSRLPRHRQRAGDSADAAGGNACCQTRVRV